MDLIDRAQELEQKRYEEAAERIRQQRVNVKPSREFCIECGEPIPEGRRLAVPGVELCVNCKQTMRGAA